MCVKISDYVIPRTYRIAPKTVCDLENLKINKISMKKFNGEMSIKYAPATSKSFHNSLKYHYKLHPNFDWWGVSSHPYQLHNSPAVPLKMV